MLHIEADANDGPLYEEAVRGVRRDRESGTIPDALVTRHLKGRCHILVILPDDSIVDVVRRIMGTRRAAKAKAPAIQRAS